MGAEITQAMLDAIGLVIPDLNNTDTNITEPSVSFNSALAHPLLAVAAPHASSSLCLCWSAGHAVVPLPECLVHQHHAVSAGCAIAALKSRTWAMVHLHRCPPLCRASEQCHEWVDILLLPNGNSRKRFFVVLVASSWAILVVTA